MCSVLSAVARASGDDGGGDNGGGDNNGDDGDSEDDIMMIL
jgi:hypothetical protein